MFARFKKRHDQDEWCRVIAEHCKLCFLQMKHDGIVVGQYGKTSRKAQQLKGASYVACAFEPLASGTKPILANITRVRPGRAVALLDVEDPKWRVVICNAEWRGTFGDAPVFWMPDVNTRGGSTKVQLNSMLDKKEQFSLNVITHNGRDSHVLLVTYGMISQSGWSLANDRLYVAEVTFSASNRTSSLSASSFQPNTSPPASLNCKVVALIGRGSMGLVMKAILQDYGEVAVKLTRCSATVASREMEAELGKELQHPNVVRVMNSVSVTQGGYRDTWQVMELCHRGSLRSNLSKLTDQSAFQYCRDIANGMAYIHAQSIIHTDVNLNNVLVGSDGKAKIGDLGISRYTNGNVFSTNSLGTVNYMPPELLFHQELSPAADIYSYGIVMWELWHRRLAWSGMSKQDILQAKRNGNFPEWASGPADVASLAARCCESDPKSRPSFATICHTLGQISSE